MANQDKYKIIIDIDGVIYSVRFPNILQLGSAVFKIFAFEDFGCIAVKPWKHFIPVKMDLTDFE